MPTKIQLKTPKLGAFKKLSFQLVERMLFDLAGGESVASIAREYGVSRPAVRYWEPYAGLSAYWLRVVRAIERDNLFLAARLQRANGRLRAAKELIKQIEPRPKRRSLYSCSIPAGFDWSREEANALCGVSHSSGHRSARQEGDHKLVALMRKYQEENPGFGFAKVFQVILSGQGCTRNHAEMLYRKARLQRHWPRKKIAVPERVARKIVPEFLRDEVWAIDFLVDALPSGKRYFVLSAIDEFSRECVLCKAMFRPTAAAVVSALEQLRAGFRIPEMLRSDKGAQFTSHAYKAWTKTQKVKKSYSRPSTPSDNAYVERFNGTIRQEVLNCYTFRSLAEVQRMLDDWRVRYNTARPHKSLHGLSPLQFVELYGP